MALSNENICVDLETLSTRSNAVIVTLAAVRFDLKTDEQEIFCVNINPVEGKKLGLHISQDTLDWWMKQPPEAVKAWQHSRIGITEALTQFNEWCGETKDTNFWCNGTNFDFPVLESSYEVVDMKEPWRYFNLMDMRTIYKVAKLDFKKFPRVGQHHNAVDDCRTQIAALKACMG